MEQKSFWENITRPVIGLSPMDGVTDLSYRAMQAKHGNPDVIFTEFIPVEGIIRLSHNLLHDFWYVGPERPVVAQIYGNDPQLFYYSAQLVCELGFDGVDINMGCPARSVVHRGCGAALIETPDVAVELIKATKKGVTDWYDNRGIDWDSWPEITKEKAIRLFDEFITKAQKLGIYSEYKHTTGRLASNHAADVTKFKLLPVSVKTRIGFATPVVERWIPQLLAAEPAVISVHGRTLKQLYTGLADWGEAAKAIGLRDKSGSDTLIFGNGDIKTATDAVARLRQYKFDGVLIGRGTFGNPWIFNEVRQKLQEPEMQPTGVQGVDLVNTDERPALEVIFAAAKEHALLQEKYKPEQAFVQVRKNLAWYIRGIHDATTLRSQLVRVTSAQEVANILDEYLANAQ